MVAVCAQLLLFVGVHSVPLSTSEEQSKETQTISEGGEITMEDQDSQNFDRYNNRTAGIVGCMTERPLCFPDVLLCGELAVYCYWVTQTTHLR